MKKILLILFCALLVASQAEALNLSRVKTWSAEVLTHTDLNAEFDNILNHAIDNDDISATAGIVGSKLDLSVPGPIGAATPGTGAFSTLDISGNATLGNDYTDSVHFVANTITFEGATDDGNETTLAITDPTSDKTITLPDETGTIVLQTDGDTIVFEGSSADDHETTISITNPTADRTITVPNETGTVITTGSTTKAIVTFTRDYTDASGNQTITGVGFTPTYVYCITTKDADDVSWGMDDGTTPRCTYRSSTGAFLQDNFLVRLDETTSTKIYTGKVDSFNSDGWVMSWTRTGTTSAGTIYGSCTAYK
ncbi:MAG TPA: hypothetical protein ENF20_06950 [Candidatus Marinimicrobia bacterium]|nr:hypothetical protein [Candidatus Neomarinimicrobiota bacterium]